MEPDLGGFNPGSAPEAYAVANALSDSAENYINDPSIEAAWAIRAYENAETHMSILVSCDPQHLKLSDQDDELYKEFRLRFPDLPVAVVNEDDLKSNDGKTKWRPFLEGFKDKVEDYNFGTLLRIDSNGLYDSNNTTLVPKTQFLAIEVARNREGHNSKLRITFRNLYNEGTA